MQKSTKKLLIVVACIVAVVAAPYGIWRLVHRPELELGESEKFTEEELALAIETVNERIEEEGCCYIKTVYYNEMASDEMLDGFSSVNDKANSIWLQTDIGVDYFSLPFYLNTSSNMGIEYGFGWTLTRQENGTWEIIRGCCGYG